MLKRSGISSVLYLCASADYLLNKYRASPLREERLRELTELMCRRRRTDNVDNKGFKKNVFQTEHRALLFFSQNVYLCCCCAERFINH